MAPSSFASQRELVLITTSDSAVRSAPSGLMSAAGSAAVEPLQQVLSSAGATVRPLLGMSEDRMAAAVATLPPGFADPGVAQLASFFRVEAADDQLEDVAHELRGLDAVQGAFVAPGAEPPVYLGEATSAPGAAPATAAPPVTTPDFTARQAYLDAAPTGVDARHAWAVPGGTGVDVRIVDVEGDWRLTHEDLLQNQGGLIGGTLISGGTPSQQLAWRNHGTAVIGEFGGDSTSFGVTGIAPDANTRAVSIFGLGPAAAIVTAANSLRPGDILLIELHRPGPRHNFQVRNDQAGYIAMEWWPDLFAAIRYAVGRGVVVVEAAGNGGEDLDDTLYDTPAPGFPAFWHNPFRSGSASSEAVLVGAGAPPPGTHGRNHGADRSRLSFSNYGSRVDAQGWGLEVTTCGYADLQGGPNEDTWYTDTFAGTSSASPIVVGALAAAQGVQRATGRTAHTSPQAIALLRATGSPQQDTPGRPASQRIGNRPDLRQMVTAGTDVMPWPGVYLKYPPLTRHGSVVPWQERMVQRGYPLVVDGLYGQQSKAACTDFQQKHALKADGIVGPNTWAAVFS